MGDSGRRRREATAPIGGRVGGFTALGRNEINIVKKYLIDVFKSAIHDIQKRFGGLFVCNFSAGILWG